MEMNGEKFRGPEKTALNLLLVVHYYSEPSTCSSLLL